MGHDFSESLANAFARLWPAVRAWPIFRPPLTKIYPKWPGDANLSKPGRTGSSSAMDIQPQFLDAQHYGTHIDAPAHFAKGGATVDHIPVERFR